MTTTRSGSGDRCTHVGDPPNTGGIVAWSSARVRQPKRCVERTRSRRRQVTCKCDNRDTSQNEAYEDWTRGRGVLVSVLLATTISASTATYDLASPEKSPRAAGLIAQSASRQLGIRYKRAMPSWSPVSPPLTEAVAAAHSGSSSELLPTKIRSQTQVAAAPAVAEAAVAAKKGSLTSRELLVARKVVPAPAAFAPLGAVEVEAVVAAVVAVGGAPTIPFG